MKVSLQPLSTLGIERSEVTPPVKLDELHLSPIVESLVQDYKVKKALGHSTTEKVPECLQNISREEVEIVFLGTGAAIPYKLRNVSSIYMHFFSRGGLLIDAGESAYTQLCRKYGAKIDYVLLNLKCIWISHKHADHHLSLPTILLQRQKVFEKLHKNYEPPTIIGPFYTSGYLEELSWFHPLKFRYFHCSDFKSPTGHVLSEFLRETFGLRSFFNVRVPHIVDSYGLIMESESGWKFVYSGDTSPCDALVEAGQNATLLVHEATMENALQAEAAGRGHSSTADALNIGRRMNSYRTILTHFSARHHHFPVPDFVNSTADELSSNAMVAFDLMTVNFKQLPYIPFLMPVLVQMYKEDVSLK